MDSTRFDRWTRRLATGTDRRTVVRGLAAATLAGALTRLGGERAAAAAPCTQFCRDARTAFHAICPNAGGRTVASFACDPRGAQDGTCGVSTGCTSSVDPSGPANPDACKEVREFCRTACADADRVSIRCSPALNIGNCSCST